MELLSPTGARVVTIIINLPYYTSRALLSPAGARAVTVTGSYYTGGSTLLSPAGARAVTRMNTRRRSVERGCCPPQGRELLRDVMRIFVRNILALLSPAGARVVTNYIKTVLKEAQGCCPPQGRELLRKLDLSAMMLNIVAVPRRGTSCYVRNIRRRRFLEVAVPRRGASCYLIEMSKLDSEDTLLSPAEARVVTTRRRRNLISLRVAVPRRGASCYGKNAKNTMRIFDIPTIFLYYLLYFCVSIRDIVGFLWCEPACNNFIYCHYSTRFASNQPVLKPSSIATGCKTQRHKL